MTVNHAHELGCTSSRWFDQMNAAVVRGRHSTLDDATLSQNIPSVARRSSEGLGVGGTTQDGCLCPDPELSFLYHRVDPHGNHLTDFSELWLELPPKS